MKIADNIYIVGSGDNGFGLTHYLDCTVYLVDVGNNQLILIDAGIGLETERILAEIQRDGFDPTHISDIFLTHSHVDHAGGAHYFVQNFGTKVWALEPTAKYVSAGSYQDTSFDRAALAGIYPQNYQFYPCDVETLIPEIPCHVGNATITAIATPGHCSGHACYLVESNSQKHLFSGDLIFAKGKIAVQNLWDSSIPEYFESIKTIARMHPQSIFPSHGPFLLNRGYSILETAERIFSMTDIPQNY